MRKLFIAIILLLFPSICFAGFTYTTNFSLAKPDLNEPGANWWSAINGNFDTIDTQLARNFMFYDSTATISAVHTLSDNIARAIGTDADWNYKYDSSGIRLLWWTSAYNGSADSTPMFEVEVNSGGGTLDPGQMIFAISNYTTKYFKVYEGGDVTISGELDTAGVNSTASDGAHYMNVDNTGDYSYTPSEGDFTCRADTDKCSRYDGTNDIVFLTQNSKQLTLGTPGGSADWTLFYTDRAITITKLVGIIRGSSTPSITWTVRHSTDRSATGNEVVTGGTTTTSTTTGSVVTSFNDATVPADSFIWLETTAQSGTVDELTVIVIFREDW